MARKKKFNVDEALSEFRRGMVRPSFLPNTLAERLAAADELIVTKPFNGLDEEGNEKAYVIGDPISKALVLTWRWGAKMIDQNYFVPPETWLGEEQYQRHNNYLTKTVEPLLAVRTATLTELGKAKAKQVATEVEAKHWRSQVEDWQGRLDNAERDIEKALTGPAVDELAG